MDQRQSELSAHALVDRALRLDALHRWPRAGPTVNTYINFHFTTGVVYCCAQLWRCLRASAEKRSRSLRIDRFVGRADVRPRTC